MLTPSAFRRGVAHVSRATENPRRKPATIQGTIRRSFDTEAHAITANAFVAKVSLPLVTPTAGHHAFDSGAVLGAVNASALRADRDAASGIDRASAQRCLLAFT